MYKNNSRFSSNIKVCSPLQLSCNLTEMKPAIGYYSYTKRWQTLKNDEELNFNNLHFIHHSDIFSKCNRTKFCNSKRIC